MKLWEIILPLRDNQGASLVAAHKTYQTELLKALGGFTALNVKGQWLDGGKVYHDDSVAYRLLSDARPRLPFNLFPDQLALYVAQIGQGEIVSHT